jgi:hypothetical protein
MSKHVELTITDVFPQLVHLSEEDMRKVEEFLNSTSPITEEDVRLGKRYFGERADEEILQSIRNCRHNTVSKDDVSNIIRYIKIDRKEIQRIYNQLDSNIQKMEKKMGKNTIKNAVKKAKKTVEDNALPFGLGAAVTAGVIYLNKDKLFEQKAVCGNGSKDEEKKPHLEKSNGISETFSGGFKLKAGKIF